MAKKPTIIKINGRTYNADNGKIVTPGIVDHTKAGSSGQVIDGFAAPHQTRRKQPAASQIHKAPQKTKKLHPIVANKSKPAQIKNTTKVAKSAKEQSTVAARHELSRTVKTDRANRAKQSAKSDKVARFGKASATKSIVRKAPNLDSEPPVAMKQARRKTEEDTEETVSWYQRLKIERPRLVPTTVTVSLTLLLVGYVTYLNLPNMALRVAASRAGFEASLPGYKPTGFSLDGPITYAPGQIALTFGAAADERQFELVQRKSTWDSQSLLDNYVVRENKRYVTFQEGGLTIYVYDDSNATWVNNGIWYTVEGESLLSSEQLLKIATSL